MSRSEKLLDMYNVQPLKSPNSKPSVKLGSGYNSQPKHGTRQARPAATPLSAGTVRSRDAVSPARDCPSPRDPDKGKDRLLLRKRDRDQLLFDQSDVRVSMFSPVPRKDPTDADAAALPPTTLAMGQGTDVNFPEIMVETCEESLPPINRRPTETPSYISPETTPTTPYARSSSTNSLSVPFAVVEQTSQDGRAVVVTNLDRGMSRSDGCIPQSFRSLGRTDSDKEGKLIRKFGCSPGGMGRQQPKSSRSISPTPTSSPSRLLRSPSPGSSGPGRQRSISPTIPLSLFK